MKASALPLCPLSPEQRHVALSASELSPSPCLLQSAGKVNRGRRTRLQTDPAASKTRLSSALTPLLLTLETGYSPHPHPHTAPIEQLSDLDPGQAQTHQSTVPRSKKAGCPGQEDYELRHPRHCPVGRALCLSQQCPPAPEQLPNTYLLAPATGTPTPIAITA